MAEPTWRAEAEARFHQHLLELLDEFQTLRDDSLKTGHKEQEDDGHNTDLTMEDMEPSAGMPRSSQSWGTNRHLSYHLPPARTASRLSMADTDKDDRESIVVPSLSYFVAPDMRQLYLRLAGSRTGKLSWKALQSLLKRHEKLDLAALEADIRAVQAQQMRQLSSSKSQATSNGEKQKNLQINFGCFAQLVQGELNDLPKPCQERLLGLRTVLQEEAANIENISPVKAESRSWWRFSMEDMPIDIQTFLLEIAPAFVILANAVVIGWGADDDPDAPIWQVLEWLFTLIFTCEAMLRMRWTGCKTYFSGPDAGWNYFDLVCLVCAYTDILVTLSMERAVVDDESNSSLDGIMLIKILRLARVCRIIRVMRFGAVRELRVIILGVLSGVRVLFWAIVLLFFTVYVVGVSARMVIGEEPEFSTVTAAMMTTFRCVTDGCSSANGNPLHEHLRAKHGAVFMLVYMVLFLFVVIGIFNLIMAVFLDSVLNDHVARELQELGYRSEEMEEHISYVIATLSCGGRVNLEKDKPKNFCQWFCGLCCRRKKAWNQLGRRSMVHREMNSEVAVAREDFNRWLDYPEMTDMLVQCKIENLGLLQLKAFVKRSYHLCVSAAFSSLY
ncbi:unnamed protein product [Effrenium voratum]|nr:unnamed protein product [Effrenium voratum]